MKKQIGSSTFPAHIKSVRERKACKVMCRNIEDDDTAEITSYLKKLKSLVPFMPKNKKISKPEVISYVIEYIHRLRETLGLPPCNTELDLDSKEAKNFIQSNQSSSVIRNMPTSTTQPSIVISSSIVQPNSSHRPDNLLVPSAIPDNHIRSKYCKVEYLKVPAHVHMY